MPLNCLEENGSLSRIISQVHGRFWKTTKSAELYMFRCIYGA